MSRDGADIPLGYVPFSYSGECGSRPNLHGLHRGPVFGAPSPLPGWMQKYRMRRKLPSSGMDAYAPAIDEGLTAIRQGGRTSVVRGEPLTWALRVLEKKIKKLASTIIFLCQSCVLNYLVFLLVLIFAG